MRGSVTLLALVLSGCASERAVDPTKPNILWRYRISPPGPGRPRAFTRPAIGPDGIIYAGGSLEDQTNTAVLHAVSPGGEAVKSMAGMRGDHRGAPSLWPVARQDGSGAFAVDEAGGLYSLHLDGEDVFREAPQDAFTQLQAGDPKFMGPILAGKRGEVYAGGWGALYVLYIEGRGSPVSFSVRVPGKGKVIPALGPEGRVLALDEFFTTARDPRGEPIGFALPAIEDGAGRSFGPSGAMYRIYGVRLENIYAGSDWSYELTEFATSQPRVAHRETIYFTTANTFYAVGYDRALKWKFRIDQGFESEPLLTEDRVYVMDTAGTLIALSPEGEEKWRLKLGPRCWTPAAAPGGTIYVACEDGLLYAVEPPRDS
jgi:outer membrane protein assembly factor BamB